jgi:chemosensory pili system protein ChpC
VSAVPNELYSLLIPLRAERLLVPRMCVAEVITFTDAKRAAADEALPSWFLGTIDWNGRRLPVVAFDTEIDGSAQRKRGRTRIVVFHCIGRALKGGHFGLLTQGFPQLVRVNPDVLQADSEQALPEFPPALCRARMIHEYPLIPDLERVEQMIAELPGFAA